MIPRRGGTPLGAGAPSLQASNQAQIDDLVQRNRTLEHTVKKLTEQVALEVARSKEQWQREQQEWREGCDVLQSCHKIVQLRNIVDLESEKMNVLKELDVVRKEKLKRLQRDYRITMFQVKETELEGKILELEDEKESIRDEYEGKLRRLKATAAEYAAQAKAAQDELAVAQQEREELEEKLGKLREDHARRDASTEMLDSRLERTTLQLDGAQTKISDLERTNAELKRTNSEIQRQLAKWQNLETKGDQEVEILRKKRIELEVQVKELEARLAKNTEQTEQNLAALEKEKRRVEKYKQGVTAWQAEAMQNEADAEESRGDLEKARKQIEKLKAELEIQTTRVQSSARKKGKRTPDTSEDEVTQTISMEQASSPPRAKSPAIKPKPRSRKAQPGPAEHKAADSDSESESIPSGSDVQEIPKPKGKAKADDEVVEGTAKQQGKRKRKVPSRENEGTTDVEAVPAPTKSKKAASRAPSEARGIGSKSKPGKEVHRGVSVQPRHIPEEDTQISDTAPKKKKRKINLFPTNAESTAFNFTSQLDNGLNIPTVLSPVRATEGIPSRSTSGSIMGTVHSMLKNSFASTRR